MGRKIANHNAKILKPHTNPTPQRQAVCNCQTRRKNECPVPGARNQDGVIYQATVTTTDGKEETYVGLAKKF